MSRDVLHTLGLTSYTRGREATLLFLMITLCFKDQVRKTSLTLFHLKQHMLMLLMWTTIPSTTHDFKFQAQEISLIFGLVMILLICSPPYPLTRCQTLLSSWELILNSLALQIMYLLDLCLTLTTSQTIISSHSPIPQPSNNTTPHCMIPLKKDSGLFLFTGNLIRFGFFNLMN